MPPLAFPHTEARGLKPQNRRFSTGDYAAGVLKQQSTLPAGKREATGTIKGESAPSSSTGGARQQLPARGREGRERGRKVERKRSSSLSTVSRHRVRPAEEIPPSGAFQSVRAKYLQAAKLASERGIYSRAELATVGTIEEAKIRPIEYSPRRGVQRTRSRSLTHLDQRTGGRRPWKEYEEKEKVDAVNTVQNVVERDTRKKPSAAQQVENETIQKDVPHIPASSQMAPRKSWRRPLDTAESAATEETEETKKRSSVVITASRKKIPQRTRSRSLTHLDLRNGGRSPWRRSTADSEEQNLPVIVKMKKRESWIKPIATQHGEKQETKQDEPDVSACNQTDPLHSAIIPSVITKDQNLPFIVKTMKRESWIEPTATKQVEKERHKLTLEEEPTAIKRDAMVKSKSWKRPSQTIDNQKAKESEESKQKPSAGQMTRKVPQRTRSRSLTQLDQRLGGRRPRRRASVNLEDQGISDPVIKMALRHSWIKPKQEEEEPKKGESARGRDVTPKEIIQSSSSPSWKSRSVNKAPQPWRPPQVNAEPTRRGVRRMRSRSLTSLRKDRAGDGTVVRTYLDYSMPDKWKPLKDRSATKIQTIARGYVTRLRWITRKPWLQKKKIVRDKDKELIKIDRQKSSTMLAFKYELEDEESEREKRIKELLREKASLEKQLQIQKETKNAIKTDIRKEKEEEKRLKERKTTDLALTLLQSTAATGIHVQQAGSKQRLKAYNEEIEWVRRELLETQAMWDCEKERKRNIDECIRRIIRAVRENPNVDTGLVDYLVKYSGLDI
jgi:hypothetical protein